MNGREFKSHQLQNTISSIYSQEVEGTGLIIRFLQETTLVQTQLDAEYYSVALIHNQNYKTKNYETYTISVGGR